MGENEQNVAADGQAGFSYVAGYTSEQMVRMECLRLACGLVTLDGGEAVQTAQRFLAFVNGEAATKA